MRPSRLTIQCEIWLLRHKRGDRSVMEEMIRHWEKPLFYYLRRMVEREEDAWDCLQEVWMKAFSQLTTLREAAAMPAWLYKIARNAAVSHFRVERHYQEWDEDRDVAMDTEVSFPRDWIDVLDLHQAMQQLSLPHREVITLHFLEDFSVDEISDIVGVSPGTVKSRLHYAKRALREQLEEKKNRKGERHA